MKKKILYPFLFLAVCIIFFNGTSIETKAAQDEKFTTKITKIDKRINKGSSFDLSLSGTKKTPSWKTSNKSIGAIKKKSKYKYTVKGVKKGDCTISVKAGKTIWKLTLHVENPSLPSEKKVTAEKAVTLSMSGLTSSARPTWTLETGKTGILKMTPSANKHSATLIGLKDGTARVYVTVCGRSYTCKVSTSHTCSKHLIWKQISGKANCVQGQYCSICGKRYGSSTRNQHTNIWVTSKAATCTAAGTQTEQCKYCGKKTGKTKAINALGHQFEFIFTSNPTCGAEGKKVEQCKRCKEMRTTPIPATGNHIWDKGTVTKKATSSETGTKQYTCRVCGKTKTEVIPKTGSKANSGKAKIGKPKINAGNKAKKKIVVKWSKVKNASGYEVRCIYKKKVIKQKTVNKNKRKVTFSKLKKKKKYKVQVRAFRNIKNVRYYSEWRSKTVKVKR